LERELSLLQWSDINELTTNLEERVPGILNFKSAAD
jgi:hypothetical protein